MIELFKRLVLLYKVGNRYDISIRLHSRRGKASFQYIQRIGVGEISWMTDKKIYLCLWDYRFYANLFHELGHLLDAKLTDGCVKGRYEGELNEARLFNNRLSVGTNQIGKASVQNYIKESGNKSLTKILVKETIASRYAVRLLKSTGTYKTGDTSYLERCLGSYTQFVDNFGIADTHYKLSKLLRG